ncbi:hypothetical protein [Streptosporangium jomthongense]|uniref:Uncharacterized protein n=1 Tax=Streptosporangium jomthongense TaxID=1193683 RepID=A0ABV8FBX9_9ACTN
MSGLDPAVAWLEEQANVFAALPDNAARPTVPPYLVYNGAEQPPPTALHHATMPVTGGIAHVAVDGPIPDGLTEALDDLARTTIRNHGGEATL